MLESYGLDEYELTLGDGKVMHVPKTLADDEGRSVEVPDMRGLAECPRCQGHAGPTNAVQGGILVRQERVYGIMYKFAVACPECAYGAYRHATIDLPFGDAASIPSTVSYEMARACAEGHPARAEALAAIRHLLAAAPRTRADLVAARREHLVERGESAMTIAADLARTWGGSPRAYLEPATTPRIDDDDLPF